ncbi:GGDEF domain-containing protein [Amphritea sp. HPY]|uniref:GGDEF domain-containing protein n=1 Tax=Amphritea sp. HPY TaxID=3421652 RepID=UPI003D7C423F
MVDTSLQKKDSKVQPALLIIAALMVFSALYVGVRSYEERVAVQAVRLAVEHRVDEVDYELVGKAKGIDELWSAYGPQQELTESDFYSLADPIVDSHHTFLPLFISLMGGGLSFVMLGMAMSLSGRSKEYHQIIEHKNQELKRHKQKLDQASIIDDETGLINRRYFDTQLNTECRRAVREFSPLTLLLIEIDPVENEHITESFPAECVAHISDLLKTAISRPGDVAARFDQRSFALLLPATNEQSPVLADRLCEQAREIELSEQNLSISIGICTMQPSALLSSKTILLTTQKALEKARKQGGDQVCSDTEAPRDFPVTY